MELKIIKDGGKEMIVEFDTEDFTLPDLIASELSKNKDVSFAGAFKDHPETGKPKLVVRTERKKPKDALEKALKGVEEQLAELKEKLSKKSK